MISFTRQIIDIYINLLLLHSIYYLALCSRSIKKNFVKNMQEEEEEEEEASIHVLITPRILLPRLIQIRLSGSDETLIHFSLPHALTSPRYHHDDNEISDTRSWTCNSYVHQ